VKQTLEQFAERFKVVSSLANQEDIEIREHYGGGTISAETAGMIAVNEPHPAAQAMSAFLEELPESVLYSLAVLMYAGREGDDVLEAVEYYCRRLQPSEAAVQAIVEKRPRVEYMEKGIRGLEGARLPELLSHVEAHLQGVANAEG